MRHSTRPVSSALLAAMLTISACAQSAEPTTTTVVSASPGAADPAAAVTELFAALGNEDYERAADLTVDDQMVAIAVAEDSTLAALEMVLEDGGNAVAANYWEGFAANLGALVGVEPSEVVVGDVDTMEIDGVEFARVEIGLPVDTAVRRIVVQNGDGWKVDVVATFAPTLAARLARTVDSLRADAGAAEVVQVLSAQRPSLDAALRSGSIDAETASVIQTAIEILGA